MTVLDKVHQAADSTGTTGRVLRRVESVLPSATPSGRWVPVPTARAVPRRRHSVSVVVPCYNYGRFLPSSVGSALAQEGVEVQVVVVDDKSTDDSLAVARALAARDDRVVVVEQPVNSGQGQTFNAGLPAATGEFVVRLDADDLLTPGALARAVALFEAHPEVGLVYGHPRHFTGDVPSDPVTRLDGWTLWTGREWVAERCRRGHNCITTPEAMLRTSVLDEVGPLNNDDLRFAQDMEIWMRVASVSDVARVVGPDQALHRDHPGSLSAREGSKVMTDMAERRTAFDLVFTGPGQRLPGAAALHGRARRALAREALTGVVRAYDAGRVGTAPVEELERFAGSLPVDVRRLPAWWAMRLRQRVGERWSRRLFVAAVVRRRLAFERSHVRWVRTGL